MRRRPAPAVVALALGLSTVVLATGSGADAVRASEQRLSHSFACGLGDGVHRDAHLSVYAAQGYWYDYDGNRIDDKSDSCYSEQRDSWDPGVPAFSATFRWYAGSQVVKQSTSRLVRNEPLSYQNNLNLTGVRQVCGSPYFTYRGERVRVQVTLHRSGYAAKSVSTNLFSTDGQSSC